MSHGAVYRYITRVVVATWGRVRYAIDARDRTSGVYERNISLNVAPGIILMGYARIERRPERVRFARAKDAREPFNDWGGGGLGCNKFVHILGWNGTKIAPPRGIFDQPPRQIR